MEGELKGLWKVDLIGAHRSSTEHQITLNSTAKKGS